MTEVSEAFNGKAVLVTGGAGAIGGNLVKELVRFDIREVVIIDDFSSSYPWNAPRGPKIRLIQGDILDNDKLALAFSSKPEIVYHLAAHFANQNSVDHPEEDLMVNGMGILKVLQQAHRTGVSRFVYASSGCGIYGSGSKMPFEEHDVSMELHTPYQVTKMLGELYTNYYHNLYNLPIVNARFFNSYGPGEVPGRYRNVIPNFIYWAMKKMPLPITGTGEETRDFTFVGDIIEGLLLMAMKSEAIGRAFNLAAGREIKIMDMAETVNRLANNDSGIIHTQRRDWDKKNRLLASNEKAKKMLGFKPTIEFNDGLQRAYEWFKQNWTDIDQSAEF